MTGQIWTASNILSLIRLLLVIPISWLLIADEPSYNFYTVLLILIAILTDFFDGRIARRFNQITEFGKIIDPIADKIAVGVVSILLTLQGKLPMWFLVAVLARDIAIFSGGLYIRKAKRIVLESNVVGKWAVTIVAVLLVVTVLDIDEIQWLKEILIALSAIFLILSFVLYLKRYVDVVGVKV
ncbi:MAG: CDP-alcohol phosphatidyltransferase family protein [Ignavibacteriae bacterium]|nr:CDP-alcohol phosphatidyltransferase family protein [Ignavibacteriota bacterium]